MKSAYPNQWAIIEALDDYTTSDSMRHIEKVSVVEKCDDGEKAIAIYRQR